MIIVSVCFDYSQFWCFGDFSDEALLNGVIEQTIHGSVQAPQEKRPKPGVTLSGIGALAAGGAP